MLCESFKLPAVRKDVPDIVVVVFHMRLLGWSLWVTIKNVCP